MAVEVKRYKNTGLDYIQGREKVLFKQGGVVVLLQDFLEWDAKNIVMAQVLSLAGRPECSGFDFDHAEKTGLLRRKSNKEGGTEVGHAPAPAAMPPLAKTALPEIEEPPVVDLPLPENRQEAQAKFADKVLGAWKKTWAEVTKSFKPGEQKEKPAAGIHSSTLLMLIVIVVVGLGSLMMSGYHIITYMYHGGRSYDISVVTGVIMALFSAIAFTAARHFWMENKVSARIIASLFVGFGVIVIAFAMYATMTVNYDQFKAGADAKVTVAVEASSEVKAASKREEFVQRELDRLDKAIAQADIDARRSKAAYDAENAKGAEANANIRWQHWVAYDKASKASKAMTEERKPYAAEMLAPTTSVVSAEAKVKQEAESATIFGMLAKLFGIDADLVKFIMYVIPAVFYDLMSPFALTVAMMLYDERLATRKEENSGS